MKRNLSLNRILWLLLGGALAMAMPSCGGKTGANGKSESTGNSGDGDSGDSGSTNTTGDGDGDSTTSGSTTSTSGDGDGDGDTSTGGDGDGDGDTSTGGDGDRGTGGSNGDGDGDASGGSGGGPTANPGVKTLGESCGSPGELACAGENQKLQLLCDGDEWVSNGTCSGAEVCDTGEANRGSCQEPIEGCLDREPGEYFCADETSRACGPDRVTIADETECDFGCWEGKCSNADPCPLSLSANCTETCTNPLGRCGADSDFGCKRIIFEEHEPTDLEIRIPAYHEVCSTTESEGCVERVFLVHLEDLSLDAHVNLPSDWMGLSTSFPVSYSDYPRRDVCTGTISEGCIDLPPVTPDASVRVLILVPKDENAISRNLVIEEGKCIP